jgi:hypothetical protein
LCLLAAAPLPAQMWTLIDSEGPSGRRNSAAIYDPVGDRVLLHGGRGSSGDLADLWAFDVQTDSWQQLSAANEGPSPRFTHNAVYDDANHRMLLWSGRELTAAGSTLLNDVWELDLSSLTWRQRTPTTVAPVARYGTAAVFDPLARQLVTFAGFTTQGRFNDTWRFAPDAAAWSDVTAASEQPGERCLHAAAYDNQRHHMLIFGGQRGSASLDDAWALDLTTDVWTQLPSAAETGGRRFPAAAYHEGSDRLLVFGGLATDGSLGGDLWALPLHGGAWQQLTDSGPAARDGAVLVAIGSQSRLLLHGGTAADGNKADTWSLRLPVPVTAVTELDEVQATPAAISLRTWPNPFNAQVILHLQLAFSGDLTIYDSLGQPVRQLGTHPAGARQLRWDGHDDSGQAVASGVYLAVVRSASQRRIARLVLLR